MDINSIKKAIFSFDGSFKSYAKIIGLIFVFLLIILMLVSFSSFFIRSISSIGSYNNYKGMGHDKGFSEMDNFRGRGGMESKQLMNSSISPIMPPRDEIISGNDLEDFEIKRNNTTIKEANIESTCKDFMNLKSKKEIIFERSSQNTNNCSFSFKTPKEKETEITDMIKNYNIENSNTSIQTIKASSDNKRNELDELNKKIDSDAKLSQKTVNNYDEILEMAKKEMNIETIAKVTQDKLNFITKMHKEKMNLIRNIDRLTRQKNDQSDNLRYSYFSIYVYKDKIIDLDLIKSEWRNEIKTFINDINQFLQDISLNFMIFLLKLIQVALYAFSSVFALKISWKVVYFIWKKIF